MKKINRKWINEQLNMGKPVQVACAYSNVCRWNYLTTSGNVTREEFGFEDATPEDRDEQVMTMDLPVMSWASVKRLQRALTNMQIQPPNRKDTQHHENKEGNKNMKHQTTETTTPQAPALAYKKVIPQATGRIDITVKLADECRNGHADFSITGTIWEKDSRGHLVDVGSGCIHDDILRVWPEAAQFVALHLSDSNGAPLYAVENGFYHLHDEEHTPARRMEIAAEHFRTTPDNLARLFTAEDENHLRLMLEDLGIVAKWKEDARAAIEKLEELTGQKWNHDYVWPRGQYTPLSKEAKEAGLKRIADGYYTPEAQAARAEAARLAKIEKKIQAIKADQQAAIDLANKKAAVELWILKKTEELKKANPAFLFDSDMVIFYTHSNTLAFNWLRYGARFTKENFSLLVSSVTPEDRTELGCDVKFELK